MAKAQLKNAPSSRRGTPPRDTDAERLAALHWLAMKIEMVSIEVFITNRDKFGAVETALRTQVKLLQEIGRPGHDLDGDDCPGGYVLCRDGLCAPMCDGAVGMTSAKPRKAKRRA